MPKFPSKIASGALPEYPSKDEVQRMIEAAETPRDRMLLVVLWHTGARISEAIKVRKSDLYDDYLRLTNLKQKKKAAQKAVYISRDFVAEFRAYTADLDPTGYLFPSPKIPGRPIGRQYAWSIVKHISEKCGVMRPKLGGVSFAWPHSFRHGNAVHQLRSGVPIKIVKEQLGHSSLLTTELYSRLSAEDKKHFIGQVVF